MKDAEAPVEFVVGDVVSLKSGGQLMTVTDFAIDDKNRGGLECSWFDANGRVRIMFVLREALYRIHPSRLKYRELQQERTGVDDSTAEAGDDEEPAVP